MSWEELYPTVTTQAYWAVLRYDPRRADKVQELVCQAYEKYQNDVSKGKEIRKQDFKYFLTRRAREVNKRSFVKKGFGGTSTTDALSFYRRRPDSGTEIVSFDEWITSKPRGKQMVEDTVSFSIDFKNWQNTLTKREKRIFNFLALGYSVTKIAEKIKLSYVIVKECIKRMREGFIRYFQIANNKPLTALG